MRNLTAILCGMIMLGASTLVLAATDDTSNSSAGSTSTEMQSTDTSIGHDGSSMENDSADSKVTKDSSKKAPEGRTTGKGKNLNKGKTENMAPEDGGRKSY